ncbi:MAG: MogA/MoaB family molybdenum cofactor biosynthesis protein [Phycisphaerales bacterium]|nr:MogA/MoaB family molybdenum cofactor biosynthesis protein [Phycisphaerales bacterium]
MSAPPLVGVLTVSDRCSRGETVDTSGPALIDLAREKLGARTLPLACVPDEVEQIAANLRAFAAADPAPDLVLTTGGTGLAPRDVTPEATLGVIERRHSGLTELIRRRCYDKTPRAYLSRGEAGTIGRTLVINLPGSTRGAVESLEALLDILPHAIETLRGEVQDDGRPDAQSRTGKVVRHADTQAEE